MIWVIASADLEKDNIFVELTHKVPFGDKLGHFCLVGIFTLLTNRALNYHFINLFSIRLLLGSLLVLVITIAEECSQLAFVSRTFDGLDMLADILGVLLFSWIGIHYQKLSYKS